MTLPLFHVIFSFMLIKWHSEDGMLCHLLKYLNQFSSGDSWMDYKRAAKSKTER